MLVEKWKTSLTKFQNINYWNDNELPASKYTALASFSEFKNGKITTSGKCLNIDTKNTISSIICCEYLDNKISQFINSKYIYSIVIFNIIGILCILSVLFNYNHKSITIFGAIFWIIIPIILILDSNITILKRIWCRSFKPWIHVYSALLETIAFCDLCSWDFRTVVIFPAMLFNQINIINSDSIYFKINNCNNNIPLVQILLSIIWKFFMLYCLRFDYFYNISPRNIIILTTNINSNVTNTNVTNTNVTNNMFYLNNASLFFTKSMSLFVLLCGQAYFKCKYKNRLYFLHTSYTIKKNKEWNLINRKKRIFKQHSINLEISNIKKKLNGDDFISIEEINF